MQKAKLLAVLTLTSTLSAFGQVKQAPGVAVGFEVRWESASISQSQPTVNITNIPASVRSIPINSGDGGNGIASLVVPVSAVTLNTTYATAFSIAPQVTFSGRTILRGGPLYTFYGMQLFRGDSFSRKDFGEEIDFTRVNFHEVNFYGTDERGEGESLVYYGIKIRPEAKPGFYGEMEFRLNQHLAILGGYSQYENRLVLDRGWDRYDSFQDYRQDQFGLLRVVHPYGGITLTYGNLDPLVVAITTGPAMYDYSLAAIAGQSNCSVNDGFTFGVALRDRFNFGRSKKN